MHRIFSLVLVLVLVTACASDGGSAPVIADLTAAPATVPVGSSSTVSGTMTFTDPDGDLDLIAITVVLPDGSSQDLPPSPVQNVGEETSGSISWAVFITPPVAGRYDLELSIIDLEDNDSNALTTILTAQ